MELVVTDPKYNDKQKALAKESGKKQPYVSTT